MTGETLPTAGGLLWSRGSIAKKARTRRPHRRRTLTWKQSERHKVVNRRASLNRYVTSPPRVCARTMCNLGMLLSGVNAAARKPPREGTLVVALPQGIIGRHLTCAALPTELGRPAPRVLVSGNSEVHRQLRRMSGAGSVPCPRDRFSDPRLEPFVRERHADEGAVFVELRHRLVKKVCSRCPRHLTNNIRQCLGRDGTAMKDY